ncbi:hypothetical protein V8D89_003445 [Ganoderma adspersum]
MPKGPQSDWEQLVHECRGDHAEGWNYEAGRYEKTFDIEFLDGDPETTRDQTTSAITKRRIQLEFVRSLDESSTNPADKDETGRTQPSETASLIASVAVGDDVDKTRPRPSDNHSPNASAEKDVDKPRPLDRASHTTPRSDSAGGTVLWALGLNIFEEGESDSDSGARSASQSPSGTWIDNRGQTEDRTAIVSKSKAEADSYRVDIIIPGRDTFSTDSRSKTGDSGIILADNQPLRGDGRLRICADGFIWGHIHVVNNRDATRGSVVASNTSGCTDGRTSSIRKCTSPVDPSPTFVD